jgi:hypothetical protein
MFPPCDLDDADLVPSRTLDWLLPIIEIYLGDGQRQRALCTVHALIGDREFRGLMLGAATALREGGVAGNLP